MTSAATEQGVDPDRFRPSADRYGETVGQVVTCLDCSHGSLAESPSPEALAAAYGEAADPVSIAEEPGQVETGRRSLALVEQAVAPERLLDVGCWTGSLVAAGAERGWQASGIEPSAWAVSRAQARGLDVRVGDLASLATMAGGFRCVALCDVIEHVLDVRAAVRAAAGALQPGGALYLTTPDAGSAAARLLGARWWSVLPMHVQYFTRASMRRLLIGESLRVVTIRTHPKVFTAAYYAERLGGYSAGLGRTGVAATKRLGVADRLVAPDFRDRMQVVAVKTGG
ncbi:MAG TPA: class I SAM-dependent methyltransferase [Mycobacteriales bacterium]|nr:class I SAM-dependent methyltransferase [Mycobacteriales bacterium]